MKLPSCRDIQAKQQHIQQLQLFASLEKYLPRWRITGVRPDGVLQTEKEDPWEEWEKSQQPRTAFEVAECEDARWQRLLAKAYPAALIYSAAEELNEEYRVAREESLAGIEAGDLGPLLTHLALIGPTLLAEPRIVPYLHDWWMSAKCGDSRCTQALTRIGRALSPGGGRPRKLSPAEVKEDDKLNKQSARTRKYCQKALDRLHQGLRALAKAGNCTRKEVKRLALNIEEEEFHRETPSKEKAKDMYHQELKKILSSLPP